MNLRLSRIADVCVILACLGIGSEVVWRRYSKPATSLATESYAKGDKLPIVAGIDVTASRKTVLLFLSTRCTYCNRSSPFYSAMGAKRRALGFRIVAVGQEPAEELAQFLKVRSVDVDSVVQVPSHSYHVRGTPTILLVDDKAIVLGVWRGLLGSRESDVKAALGWPAKDSL